jgi:hypothetical protein
MLDVMHGGLTVVKMASFITIVIIYNKLNCVFPFYLRLVNQRRATVQELLFAYWRPSIPSLTIIDLRFLKISWARITSP